MCIYANPQPLRKRFRSVTLNCLALLNSRRRATIDAVMYSLRGGVAVLARDDVQHRLAVIDEAQLLKMIDLLQKRDGKIAPRWSDEEVEQLMQTWTACHG